MGNGLDPKKTALVIIDLQKWLGNNYAPNSAEDVVAKAAQLTDKFRKAGAFVVLVHVSSKDMKDMPAPLLDREAPQLNLPEQWDEIVPELNVQETDHLIVKKQWGAFFGTDLDLQLRRRGIDTIVLAGIATGLGVDTTAREAFMLGYNQVFSIDAMSGFTQEEHDHVKNYIFPRMGKIRTTAEIIASFEG
ncbi:Isochorismatase family protein yecD [Listeria grayi]|uniref:Isochorismatase n=1 Tax=Listeria grayi FSL F6-1183 TaxID=1265827 RepID=A0A829R936_LISGR|nr:isochorismatase family protein [Listeria grayi]EUJ29299.1 isochorismatase [Listeria grayi FSL F6-1183]VEI32470.1 Isochorismatase family protein yecD [Listeria grayi]